MYAASDVLHSYRELDDEEGNSSRLVYAKFDEETHMKDPKL